MTILPKKKSTQSQNGQENDGDKSSHTSGVVHPNQLGHGHHSHQLQSSIPNHIQQAVGNSSLGSVHSERGGLSPKPHFDEDRANGASSPSPSAVIGLNKRRATYRASPLRSVRPKLREHRVGGGGGGVSSGGSSPSYPSLASHNISPLAALPKLPTPPLSPQAGPSCNNANPEDESHNSGYNSGDEYQSMNWNLTPQEWVEKERWFEKKMKKKGLVIKQMSEDGACLFRAIADQVYGDQEMNDVVRKQCMDYVQSNEEMFSPFVSENFQTYVSRKRQQDVFGNHIEIAAMSEIYNRAIEVYCYSTEPINIFQSSVATENPSIRLSYHKGTHYNSLTDPYKPTYGVGLGLPNLVPGLADKNLMKEATTQSENSHIEQTMLEDKLRATDFEATAEAIEQQVANESYLDYLKEIDRRNKAQRVGSSSSCQSSSDCSQSSSSSTRSFKDHLSPPHRSSPPPNSHRSALPNRKSTASPPHRKNSGSLSHRNPSSSPPHRNPSSSPPHRNPSSSPPHRNPSSSPPHRNSSSPSFNNSTASSSGQSSPNRLNKKLQEQCSSSSEASGSSEVDLAVPGSSKDPTPSTSSSFILDERTSLIQDLQPDMFGLTDYSRDEADVLAQVLAASQQEYLDSLKRHKD